MTPSENEDLLAALRLIAERAGKVILAYYVDADSIEARSKKDASPVTDADEAAEEAILEMLHKLTPEIPAVSEEAASAGQLPDVSEGRFWLVDPLDGTKEFLNRNGEFTVNIALIENGLPVAGIVHAPALAMTWAGAKADDEDADVTIFVAAPILQGERIVGVVSVGKPKDNIRRFLDLARRDQRFAAIVALLSTLVLGFIIYRRMSRPLDRLADFANRVSRGERIECVLKLWFR